MPLGLRTSDERLDLLHRFIGALLHSAAGRKSRGQQIAQAGVAGLQFTQLEDQRLEAIPGLFIGQRAIHRLGVARDVALEGGSRQIGAGGEAPIKRRHPHPGAGGDFLQRHGQPALGEQLGGRSQDPIAVEFRVGTKWPGSLFARRCA
jgi:hypothetical protein